MGANDKASPPDDTGANASDSNDSSSDSNRSRALKVDMVEYLKRLHNQSKGIRHQRPRHYS